MWKTELREAVRTLEEEIENDEEFRGSVPAEIAKRLGLRPTPGYVRSDVCYIGKIRQHYARERFEEKYAAEPRAKADHDERFFPTADEFGLTPDDDPIRTEHEARRIIDDETESEFVALRIALDAVDAAKSKVYEIAKRIAGAT
jgi:hypothetical protein